MNKFNINEKYRLVTEGRLAKSEFIRQVRQNLPGYINQFTSFEDAVQIFRNKGILTEEIEYQCPGDRFSLDEIEKGIRYELEQMKEYDIPTKEEYRKAREKTIENLSKDQLYYVNKQVCCSNSKLQTAPTGRTVSLQERKDPSGTENAQKLFNALMAARAKKAPRNRWEAKDANAVLTQVRSKFDSTFVPKGIPATLKYDIKSGRFSDVWTRGGAMTASSKARNVGMHENKEPKQKNAKLLKEALTRTVIKLLNEAATANLAQLSDENASIQGIPTILNSLENIVTEIESFVIKETEKIQGVFDTVGSIKNEDNIPVGYKFVQPIMQAFQKDLEPVLSKVSLENIKLPKAPEPDKSEIVEPGIDPENNMSSEEKATLFTPKGTKPDPLAETNSRK